MNGKTSVLIIAFCFLSTFAAAQTPASVPPDVINVSVLVRDTSDRAVTGLGLEDFRVLEDQVEQRIVTLKENRLVGDYTLTYTPKNPVKDGTWRRVRVEIVIPLGARLTVLHSVGYTAQ